MTPVLVSLLVAAAGVITPAEVQPHQKGICITEWNDGELIEIPIEIVGVLDATGPNRTTVLIRLDDPRFGDQGVAAGMSGSPVYIDGRLLGAVAFGWNFAREPLAGVTPFVAMRDIEGGQGSAAPTPPTLVEMAALAAGRSELLDALPRLALPPGGRPQLVAVAGLPFFDGFSEQLLARAGIEPVAAGGRDGLSGAPEPGEMLAALLTWGDATLAAAGTVTAREGDRVYAFGHPMFALGGVSVPAARARTLAVQTSYMSSFKFFTVGEPFGTVVADRTSGIVASIGSAPAGLPFTVTVAEDDGRENTWSFRVAEIPVLEPLLATFLTNSAITAIGAASGNATLELDIVATLADQRQVTLRQTMAGDDAVARVATLAGAFLGFLANSSFPHPAVTSLEARVAHKELLRQATVVEVLPGKRRVRPGEEIIVEVRLQPERAPVVVQQLHITIPTSQPPGRLDLVVGDGSAWNEYRIKAEGISPASFGEQIAEIERLEPSSTLVMALESFDAGTALPGVSQPALPPSWAATIATGLGRQAVQRLRTAIVATARWQAPYPLTGAFRIPLTVREKQEIR